MDFALVNGFSSSWKPNRSTLARLSKQLGSRSKQAEPMAAHTSWRVGGNADIYAVAESPEELTEIVQLARRSSVPYFLLGAGSNILVSDAGIRGIVIHNRSQAFTTDFEPDPSSAEHGVQCLVRANSGVILSYLAHHCSRLGLAGLEWAIGIPGTLGGALISNAGAFGSDMAGIVHQVELLDPQGDLIALDGSQIQFGYRTSQLAEMARTGSVILTGSLLLRREAIADVQERVDRFREERNRTQPRKPSAGSVFRNPPGDYAGRLIEQVGLKGHQIGDAQISDKHANFIINLGAARARDIYALITLARARVWEAFQIRLELEVQLVGDWSSVMADAEADIHRE